MKQKILVFGNPLVKEDSLALKLMPELQKEFSEIEFLEIDSTEDLRKHGKDLIILDVAKGITAPTLITDLNQLESSQVYSMHDFDLAHNLKILDKLGLLESVRIIAIPYDLDGGKALKTVEFLIRKI